MSNQAQVRRVASLDQYDIYYEPFGRRADGDRRIS